MMFSKRMTGGLAAAIAMLLQAPTVSAAAGQDESEIPSFSRALAIDYQDLANSEHAQGDERDGRRYQQRASDAAAGKIPAPDAIATRAAYLNAPLVPELAAARARLMTALEAGARVDAPAAAARAQSSFDCWLEQASEDLQAEDMEACRQSFLSSVAAIEAVPPSATPVVEVAPTTATPTPSVQGPYVVHFALDAAALDADARNVLAQVVREADGAPAGRLRIVGHASRAGSEVHNMRLSQRRADAVTAALFEGGMRADGIVTEARGEADTLVATADGMREPRNRRVEISVER